MFSNIRELGDSKVLGRSKALSHSKSERGSILKWRWLPAKMPPPWGCPLQVLASRAEVPGGPRAEKCLSFQQEVGGGRVQAVGGAPKAGREGRRPGGLNPLLPHHHLGSPPGRANFIFAASIRSSWVWKQKVTYQPCGCAWVGEVAWGSCEAEVDLFVFVVAFVFVFVFEAALGTCSQVSPLKLTISHHPSHDHLQLGVQVVSPVQGGLKPGQPSDELQPPERVLLANLNVFHTSNLAFWSTHLSQDCWNLKQNPLVAGEKSTTGNAALAKGAVFYLRFWLPRAQILDMDKFFLYMYG